MDDREEEKARIWRQILALEDKLRGSDPATFSEIEEYELIPDKIDALRAKYRALGGILYGR